ncbi:hypothetical protein [Microcoleus sp. BROC3]|uniref:hypothetical protein n=1 Tax=Microcoleus sp. BROC3 TaxID=3055323 RepID=UPI002FD1A77C
MSTCRNPIDPPKIKIVSIADRVKPSQKHQGRSVFWVVNQIWQFFFAADGPDELRIWQTSDNDGNTWWHGCDRATGRSIDGATDDEMRDWIARRYCQ